jgi:hypothetical protein
LFTDPLAENFHATTSTRRLNYGGFPTEFARELLRNSLCVREYRRGTDNFDVISSICRSGKARACYGYNRRDGNEGSAHSVLPTWMLKWEAEAAPLRTQCLDRASTLSFDDSVTR